MSGAKRFIGILFFTLLSLDLIALVYLLFFGAQTAR